MLSTSALALALAMIASACSQTDPSDGANDGPISAEFDGRQDGPPASVDPASIPRGIPVDFGPAPEAPTGPLEPEVQAAVDELFGSQIEIVLDAEGLDAFRVLSESGDARLAWLISDLLRVTQDPRVLGQAGLAIDGSRLTLDDLAAAATALTGHEFTSDVAVWGDVTSTLIAWDIPAPPGYLEAKRNIYTIVEPAWEDLFVENSAVDWRHVSWGGVLIDDRPFGTTDDPCNCIPAIDNPEVQSAGEATWLAADDIVFGVVINGEARAYPRQIMEVREMVNDTLGGRDFAMPYCTLCGAAQVWFTDDLPEGIDRPVLRTSGLLSRSNKVMYDLNSSSIFDTFLGTADSGPLHDQGIALEGHTVVTSSWAAWVAEHPETSVLVEDLALGRNFDFRNGRDANGPIFPIGDADPRLAVQEDVLGVIQEDGTPLAIHVDSALAAIQRGEIVEIDGIRVVRNGDGVQAIDAGGNDVVGHQAFWFAWSQFHPRTELWPDV